MAADARQSSVEMGHTTDGMPQPADIHVLLVDDERLSRTVVGSLLRKCEYKVTLAESGLEALEALRQHKPGTYQLVLADVMMPDVDGLELLKHVRGESSYAHIPVVMMSANERTETVLECIREGAEDYLLKPVTKKVVQCIWQHVWRRQQQSITLKASASSVTQDELPISVDELETAPSSAAAVDDSETHQHVRQQQQPAQQQQQQQQQQQAASHVQPEKMAGNVAGSDEHGQDMHDSAQAEAVAARRLSHAQASPSFRQPPAAAGAPHQNGQAHAPVQQGVALSAYFQHRGNLVNSGTSLRIFYEALKLMQVFHAQGRAFGHVLPSQLLLTPGGSLALSQVPLPATQLQLERSLYASPEELLTKPPTPASDIYSLGVLFFELFTPLTDAADRARALSGLRHRILPLQLLQQKPQEAAFVLALLHPDPSARPSVDSVMHCQLLTQLLSASRTGSAGGSSKAAATAAAAPQQTGSPDDEVLLNFLKLMRASKLAERERVRAQLELLEVDLQQARDKADGLREHREATCSSSSDSASAAASEAAPDNWESLPRRQSLSGQKRASCDLPPAAAHEAVREASGKCAPLHPDQGSSEVLTQKWRRVADAFDSLETLYFHRRQTSALAASAAPSALPGSQPQLPQAQLLQPADHTPDGPDPLAAFSEDLTRFARNSRFEVQAVLRHSGLSGAADMVCSTAFDRDDEFFATAGVGRRIKVFELSDVISKDALIHYPVAEIVSRSKLSCVVWNSYLKSSLLAADYDGRLQMWDVATRATVASWQQHSHRVWSCDFSQVDPTSFVSGSDDGTVRLWNLRQRASVACIDTKANVCSVQFSPTNPHILAFGSANYRLYLYDRRQVQMPLAVVAGHRKAVSYVRFLGGSQLVSASTDSRLKVWDVTAMANSQGQAKPCCTLTGHVNEKNFVGLSVTRDGHIACGSEDNSVYAYHRSIPLPIAKQAITVPQHSSSLLEDLPPPQQQQQQRDHQQFVSSVCWAWRGRMLVAANSAGSTQVLKLVST